jgi:hypothetical protein
MDKKYICGACDTLYNTHKCDKACFLCTATPPCTKDETKYCGTPNRLFLIENCFQNHLTLKAKGKLVCQWRQVCRNCSYTVTAYSKLNVLRNFVIIAIRTNLLAIFATCLHWNLASWQTGVSMFSLIRVAHRILKNMMGPLNTFPISYVLSRCVVNVKRWMIWVSIVNSVERTYVFGQTTP